MIINKGEIIDNLNKSDRLSDRTSFENYIDVKDVGINL